MQDGRRNGPQLRRHLNPVPTDQGCRDRDECQAPGPCATFAPSWACGSLIVGAVERVLPGIEYRSSQVQATAAHSAANAEERAPKIVRV